MTQLWFQKKKLPLQWLFRPWFLVALGLHIVALSVPLPPEPSPEANPLSTEDPSDGVRLVSLPSPPPARSPLPSVSPLPTPAVPTAPPAAPKAAPPAVAPAEPIPEPLAATPSQPQIAPEFAAPPMPTPQPLESPSPEPLTSASPEPQLTPEAQQTITPADFPHAVGSQPGCGGRDGCWQNETTQWRSIATTLRQDLESQGYTLTSLEIASDTGMRIYEVSKMGEPSYYLNLLSTLQGTVYIVSEELLTPQELTAMIGV
jgi:hypothetical protein